MIDITITATRRPDVLRRTIESFWHNMFAPKRQLVNKVFINIDPIGPGTMEDTRDVLYDYFAHDQVVYYSPFTASFPKAFIRVWQAAAKTDSETVFHLEDDWELRDPIDLTKMYMTLFLYPDLSILRLSAFPSGTNMLRTWNKQIFWNGTFFEVPPNLRGLLGFSGHPQLIRKDFVRAIVPYLDDSRNPEKQIKGDNKHFGEYIQSHRFGWYIFQDTRANIIDIGRNWMIKHRLRKKGSKAWFTEWEEAI